MDFPYSSSNTGKSYQPYSASALDSDAKRFLNGNTNKIKTKLDKLMGEASKKQMYEEAGRLRDRIKSINQIQKYQSVYIKDMRNIDIFAINSIDGKSCIHGMFYRNGSNYGNNYN